jgi:hypothetical protein
MIRFDMHQYRWRFDASTGSAFALTPKAEHVLVELCVPRMNLDEHVGRACEDAEEQVCDMEQSPQRPLRIALVGYGKSGQLTERRAGAPVAIDLAAV